MEHMVDGPWRHGQKARVVYLAGSGHTGSTLLALLLDCHPGIVSLGEAAIKPAIRRRGVAASQPCSCGAAVRDCGFWRELSERVEQQGFRFGPEHWSNDYRSGRLLVHWVLTRDSSVRAVQRLQAWAARHLPVHGARLRQTDRVNVAFVRAALDMARAEVFLDTSKLPMRLERLLGIPELDVRVITLVRDVRAYAASAKRRGYSIAAATSTWRKDQQAIHALTSRLTAERKMLLRYEDLCAHPVATLRELYRFSGVADIEPIMSTRSDAHHVLGNGMRRGGAIDIRLDESWRHRLDPDEEAMILRDAGALNRELGYA